MPCKWCEHDVAPSALRCPRCGAQDPYEFPPTIRELKSDKPFLIALATCMALGAIGGFIFEGSPHFSLFWSTASAVVFGLIGGVVGVIIAIFLDSLSN